MKIIISTGQGRLHLADLAKTLSVANFDTRLITGYVPRHLPAGPVNLIGRLIQKPDLYRRLMLRCPEGLPRERIDCCTFAEILEGLRQACQTFGLPTYSDLFTWRVYARQSLKYLHDADIFHVRSGAGCSGAIEHARQAGMKIVVDHSIAHPAHIAQNLDAESRHWPQRKAHDYDSPFWKQVLADCQKADVILVNSDYVKKSLQCYGLAQKVIQTIYLPVSRKFTAPQKRPSGNGKFRLIFTGSFNIRKGARLLLRAMQALHSNYPDIELNIYGTVSIPQQWQHQCDKSNIRFHGHVSHDRLKQALAEADVYVFPSLSEGCAKSVMEAMGAGLPVLTTEDSGAPIEHLKNGYLLETGSIDSLTEGILYAYNNRQEARQWGQQAATEVAERYTEENFALQLKAFYEQLLKS